MKIKAGKYKGDNCDEPYFISLEDDQHHQHPGVIISFASIEQFIELRDKIDEVIAEESDKPKERLVWNPRSKRHEIVKE